MQEEAGAKFWRIVVGDFDAVALVVRRDLPLNRSWLYVPRGPVMTSSGPPTGGPTSPSKGEVPLLAKERSTPQAAGEVWAVLEEHLTQLAHEENAMFIRIDPMWQEWPHFAKASRGAFRKAEREVQPRHTLKLNLTLSEEELLAQMHAKTRYNIRLAERKGVTVRFSKDEKDLQHFLRLAKEVAERAPISFHPDEYYREMLKVLGGRPVKSAGADHGVARAEIALAKHEGDVLAVNIIIYAGDTVTYAHGASSQAKKSLMAPHLLQWESIKKARQEGFKEYDFFGVKAPDVGEEDTWSGITRFKEGFGGYRESYIGAYDMVLEGGLYRAFNVARRIRGFINN